MRLDGRDGLARKLLGAGQCLVLPAAPRAWRVMQRRWRDGRTLYHDHRGPGHRRGRPTGVEANAGRSDAGMTGGPVAAAKAALAADKAVADPAIWIARVPDEAIL